MSFIRDSPRIYASGETFILIPPTTLHDRYITADDLHQIIAQVKDIEYNGETLDESELQNCKTCLIFNISYCTRVWTIQEMLVSEKIDGWPFSMEDCNMT